MIFITLILILTFTVPVIIIAYRSMNVKKTVPVVTSVNVSDKIVTDRYFIYSEGYDISLQSTLGYEDAYIQIVETEQDDVYEMHINNDYIGYIDGTGYVTKESLNFDNFLRLKVKISRIKGKIHVIQSVDDNRVLVYGRFNDFFYLNHISEIESSEEEYKTKNLIFERFKRK